MLSVRRGGGPVSAGAEYPALHPHPLPPTPRQLQPLGAVIDSLLLNPLEVDEGTRLEIAQQRYNAGDYRAALEHCNAVYMANPRRLENLLLLGAVYYQLRELDMCITKNEEAVAIQPNFPECFNNMANAWREKGDGDRAIQFYEYAIKPLSILVAEATHLWGLQWLRIYDENGRWIRSGSPTQPLLQADDTHESCTPSRNDSCTRFSNWHG